MRNKVKQKEKELATEAQKMDDEQKHGQLEGRKEGKGKNSKEVEEDREPCLRDNQIQLRNQKEILGFQKWQMKGNQTVIEKGSLHMEKMEKANRQMEVEERKEVGQRWVVEEAKRNGDKALQAESGNHEMQCQIDENQSGGQKHIEAHRKNKERQRQMREEEPEVERQVGQERKEKAENTVQQVHMEVVRHERKKEAEGSKEKWIPIEIVEKGADQMYSQRQKEVKKVSCPNNIERLETEMDRGGKRPERHGHKEKMPKPDQVCCKAQDAGTVKTKDEQKQELGHQSKKEARRLAEMYNVDGGKLPPAGLKRTESPPGAGHAGEPPGYICECCKLKEELQIKRAVESQQQLEKKWEEATRKKNEERGLEPGEVDTPDESQTQDGDDGGPGADNAGEPHKSKWQISLLVEKRQDALRNTERQIKALEGWKEELKSTEEKEKNDEEEKYWSRLPGYICKGCKEELQIKRAVKRRLELEKKKREEATRKNEERVDTSDESQSQDGDDGGPVGRDRRGVTRRFLTWANQTMKERHVRKMQRSFEREEIEVDEPYCHVWTGRYMSRTKREQNKRKALLRAEALRQNLESALLKWEKRKA
ncbi:trichohyalin-like [Engraulis encrasicolus]|uniref:trichohyalin-like n=1 Tax=Engraulis encrasicolus TaxID=184585 RepID=UPI002FD37043